MPPGPGKRSRYFGLMRIAWMISSSPSSRSNTTTSQQVARPVGTETKFPPGSLATLVAQQMANDCPLRGVDGVLVRHPVLAG